MIERSFLKGLESALFGHPSDTKRRPIAIQHQPRWLGWRAPPRHAPAGHSSERFVFVHGFVLKRLCRTVVSTTSRVEKSIARLYVYQRAGSARRSAAAVARTVEIRKNRAPRGVPLAVEAFQPLWPRLNAAKFESFHAWVCREMTALIRVVYSREVQQDLPGV